MRYFQAPPRVGGASWERRGVGQARSKLDFILVSDQVEGRRTQSIEVASSKNGTKHVQFECIFAGQRREKAHEDFWDYNTADPMFRELIIAPRLTMKQEWDKERFAGQVDEWAADYYNEERGEGVMRGLRSVASEGNGSCGRGSARAPTKKRDQREAQGLRCVVRLSREEAGAGAAAHSAPHRHEDLAPAWR